MNTLTKRLFWMAVCCLPFISSGCKQSETAVKESSISDALYQNLPFEMPKVQQPVFPAYEVNIEKFGAKGDGLFLNTKAINDAIKEVNQRGGGKVIIPEGIWLTGPIELLSNVNLYTEQNALVLFTGDFEAYKDLSAVNREGKFSRPIYVGKAVPAGARKGGIGLGADPGTALFKRLCEHLESVRAAENLNEEDFFCRYLVVDDIWIPLAESLLIEKFQPVWNRVLDGFGNHDPGKNRYEQEKSPWDKLHPGRDWANRMRPCANTQEALIERVKSFLSSEN